MFFEVDFWETLYSSGLVVLVHISRFRHAIPVLMLDLVQLEKESYLYMFCQ